MNNQLKDSLQRWIKEQINPNYEQWEQNGIIPKEVWKRAGELGFLCATQAEEYGGLGVDFSYSSVIYQELFGSNLAALGVGFAVHSDLVANYISHFGSLEQKNYYLPKMVKGELIGAISMTEPGTGSDLASVKTKAQLQNGKWIINGQKTFVSNGINSDLIIVVARTDDVPGKPHAGISLLIVDSNSKGFTRGKRLNKIGLHAQDTAEMSFDQCEIPEANLLGKRGDGFKYLMKNLGIERLGIAIMSLAQARGAFKQTIQYVNEREAFGKKIASFQNTRFKIAEILTDLDVGQAFIDQCISDHIKGLDITVKASQAKLWASEKAQEIIDTCLQFHGGYGFMEEYPIARFYRDVRVQRIYGGTSEIMKEIISKSIL